MTGTKLRTAKATTLRRGHPRVSEKVEQAHCIQLVRSIGGSAWVMGTRRRSTDFQGTMQTPGIPDLMGFVPVREIPADLGLGALLLEHRQFFFLECKAVGGRLRPEQIVFRDECRRAGIAHIVGGVDELIAWLVARGLVKAEAFPHYRQPSPAPSPKESV